MLLQIRIIKNLLPIMASSTAFLIQPRATELMGTKFPVATKQEEQRLERRMWKHLERLPAKIQEITTRDRAVGITTREVVTDTIKEAMAGAITTKILGITTIAVVAATAEAVVAMVAMAATVALMKEAEGATTLTTKEAEAAEEAITSPSMVRAAQAKTLSNGETTTAEAKIATTEAADRATHMRKAVSTKAAKEALISTSRNLLELHLLSRKEARKVGTREEDTAMFSNSGNTQSLKVLKPQQKKMENRKISEAYEFSYFREC